LAVTKELFSISNVLIGMVYRTSYAFQICLQQITQLNLDLDADWEKWKNTFLSAAADHIPRKSFKKNSSPPWFDGEIKHLINKKNFCIKMAKQSLNPSAWEKFLTLRRQVKSLLYDKRKEFFQNLPDLLKTSSKKFWSVFKSVSKHSNIPNKVSWSKDPTPHIAADNPADIANVFNRYFFSVFNTACPMPQFTSSPRPRKL
jgi:hypothetical protein